MIQIKARVAKNKVFKSQIPIKYLTFFFFLSRTLLETISVDAYFKTYFLYTFLKIPNNLFQIKLMSIVALAFINLIFLSP
jgi:hypothetical protein